MGKKICPYLNGDCDSQKFDFSLCLNNYEACHNWYKKYIEDLGPRDIGIGAMVDISVFNNGRRIMER